MAAVAVRLLGPVQVTVDDIEVAVGGRTARRLLGVLALRSPAAVTSGSLIEEVWDTPPRHPANALQAQISRLRRTLADVPGVVIETDAVGYRLHLEGVTVDVERFEEALDQARRIASSDPHDAASRFEAALAEWRGDVLADVDHGPALRTEADRLDELRRVAEEEHVEQLLSTWDAAELIVHIERLVAAEPLRERRWGQLMLACYRAGRQADALASYQRARTFLLEGLGLEPGEELQELQRAILDHDAPLGSRPARLPRRPARSRGNLPGRLSSFVGRDTELEEVTALVLSRRLITLTGTGGAGKTRLSLEVARHLRDRFVDGAWLAGLVAVSEPEVVARTVAQAFDLPVVDRDAKETVVGALEASELLLVLDNCEHILDASASLVANLLRRCPSVHVLATSREPLHVAGEVVVSVEPLALPAADAPTSSLTTSPAVMLFLERARDVRPGFEPSDADLHAVAAICRRLDGVPLALELAAARLRLLTPAQILDRIQDRFGLLTEEGPVDAVGRHRALRATVAWSHDLLDPAERATFRRTAVFRGGFTLPAAEEVVAAEDLPRQEVLEHLGALVDKSLLVAHPDGDRMRYALLETLRAFAAEQLDREHETATVEGRHAAHYLHRAIEAVRDLEGVRQPEALSLLLTEHDNLRAALARALRRHDTGLAVRLISALWPFWFRFGFPDEGQRWVQRAADAAADLPDRLRAQYLAGAANLAWYNGDYASARSQATTALSLAETLGGHRLAAASCTILGLCEYEDDRFAAAIARFRAAVEHAEAAPDEWNRAAATTLAGYAHRDAGDLGAARESFVTGYARFEAIGDPWGCSLSEFGLGTVERAGGNAREARELLERALPTAVQIGEAHGVACNLALAGGLALDEGDVRDAVTILAATDRRYEVIGAPWTPIVRRQMTADLAMARARLDPAEFTRAWAEGQRLRAEEAADFVLGRSPGHS